MLKPLVSLCLLFVFNSFLYAGSGSYNAIQKAGNRMKKQLRGGTTSSSNKQTPAARTWTESKKEGISEVRTDEMEDYVKNKSATIVDARFGKYDDRTRIPGAKSFKGNYSKSHIRKVLPDKNKLIIVYGQNSSSSIASSFAKHLSKLGYKNIKVYKTGIDAWKKAGNKIKKLKKRKKKSSS